MDIKQIHELVKLVNKSNIGELSVEKDGFKITIKQKKEATQHFARKLIVNLHVPFSEQISISKEKAPVFLKWLENV